ERRRLRRIREKQGGSSLDQALDLAGAARLMTRERITGDDVQSAAGVLKAIGSELPPKSKADPATLPPGVGAPKNARGTVDRVARELTKAGQTGDVSRRAPIAESLTEVADRVAAEALISLAYAIDIGDPDSAVLLAGNVALRHDFGFALRDGATRARTMW